MIITLINTILEDKVLFMDLGLQDDGKLFIQRIKCYQNLTGQGSDPFE